MTTSDMLPLRLITRLAPIDIRMTLPSLADWAVAEVMATGAKTLAGGSASAHSPNAALRSDDGRIVILFPLDLDFGDRAAACNTNNRTLGRHVLDGFAGR